MPEIISHHVVLVRLSPEAAHLVKSMVQNQLHEMESVKTRALRSEIWEALPSFEEIAKLRS